MSITLNCLVSNNCASEGFTVTDQKSKSASRTAIPLGVPVEPLKALFQLDLTAVSYLVVKDGIYYFKNYYYLPESCLANNSNREKYRLWRNQHQLNITSGNVTDYDYITRHMTELD